MVAAVCVALLVTSAAPAGVQPAGQPTVQSPAPPRVSYEDAERMARAGDTLVIAWTGEGVRTAALRPIP